MSKNKSLLDINEILNDYSVDIQEGIDNAAVMVAKNGADELKATTNTYKVRSGKYNKGWKVTTKKGRGFIKCTIHNTQYQLTHLLEKGHVTRKGTRTRAFVHIAPVETKSIENYEKEVIKVIKNGG